MLTWLRGRHERETWSKSHEGETSPSRSEIDHSTAFNKNRCFSKTSDYRKLVLSPVHFCQPKLLKIVNLEYSCPVTRLHQVLCPRRAVLGPWISPVWEVILVNEAG